MNKQMVLFSPVNPLLSSVPSSPYPGGERVKTHGRCPSGRSKPYQAGDAPCSISYELPKDGLESFFMDVFLKSAEE